MQIKLWVLTYPDAAAAIAVAMVVVACVALYTILSYRRCSERRMRRISGPGVLLDEPDVPSSRSLVASRLRKVLAEDSEAEESGGEAPEEHPEQGNDEDSGDSCRADERGESHEAFPPGEVTEEVDGGTPAAPAAHERDCGGEAADERAPEEATVPASGEGGEDEEHLALLAHRRFKEGAYEEAASLFRRLSRASSNPVYPYFMGKALYRAGKAVQALAAWRELLGRGGLDPALEEEVAALVSMLEDMLGGELPAGGRKEEAAVEEESACDGGGEEGASLTLAELDVSISALETLLGVLTADEETEERLVRGLIDGDGASGGPAEALRLGDLMLRRGEFKAAALAWRMAQLLECGAEDGEAAAGRIDPAGRLRMLEGVLEGDELEGILAAPLDTVRNRLRRHLAGRSDEEVSFTRISWEEEGSDDEIARLEQRFFDDPTDLGVLRCLAEAYRKGGRYADAIEALQEVVQIQGLDDELLYMFGLLHLEDGSPQVALEFWEELTREYPSSSYTQRALQEMVRMRSSKVAESEARSKADALIVLELDKPYRSDGFGDAEEGVAGLFLRGDKKKVLEGLRALGGEDEAARRIERRLASNPTDLASWKLLALIALLKRKPRRSERILRHLVEVKPRASYHYYLGLSLWWTGRRNEALTAFADAIKCEPTSEAAEKAASMVARITASPVKKG